MLFKDIRRSIKRVPFSLLQASQQQESEKENIQRLIDGAAVANKSSRVQVFELRPARSGRFWRK